MSPEQGPIFSLMACSYRYGVTDKFLPLLGDALDGVIADTGATMGDLVDAMDDAQEQTIRRIDTLLSRSSLILKVAANERLMALTSRMLDSPLVKRSYRGDIEEGNGENNYQGVPTLDGRKGPLYHFNGVG